MSSVSNVFIHSSQFPQKVRSDLLESLRTRRVNHKFHYDSIKQTQKWLVLHEAYSPARNDSDCASIYDDSFAAASELIKTKQIHIVGLGCGGGQKDTRLLKLLRDGGGEVFYTPCDVSAAMVLVACQAAVTVVPEQNCIPLVCDLATAQDLPEVIDGLISPQASRLITFFGMIPNFEPASILPRLASLIRPGDWLLFSANLAPGPDYTAGLKKILPQYNNSLTRDWLMSFLLDLGVERDDGEMVFAIESDPSGSSLKRVAASFHFNRAREIRVDTERFQFQTGESIQLFFSYRYTAGLIEEVLKRHGLRVLEKWITKSEEEGVFLCRKQT